MNTNRSIRHAILGLIVAAAGVFWLAAPAIARADAFAAIAYSPNTGNYGYAYGKGCRAEAENAAVGYCNACDAQVVVWCENASAALAVGDNGVYGYAYANCRADAERLALCYCRDAGGCNAHILCWVNSGR